MQSAITGTFSKIPRKQNSHGYGWARTWSENLGVPLNYDAEVVDTLYLDHGVNFGGSLNFFGGFTDEIKARVDNLMQASEIISLDIPMPDYGGLLKKRNDVKDKEWCDRLTDKLSTATTLISSDLEFTHLAVGDSHTAAYAPHNCSVVKKDGTTLWGQCRDDFEYIRSHIKPHHKSITISLGNIDCRHHVCRHDKDAMYSLLDGFVSFVESLDMNVEVSAPWPIEFEGRRLPKSGQYKGTNFYGSLSERQLVVGKWIGYLEEKGINLVKPPQEWYGMDPEQHAKDHMEGSSSVHLSPLFYRRMDWGLPNNSLEGFFG